MPRILAIDTTSENGSIALLEDGAVVSERLVRSPGGFGHVLFDELAAMLAACGWDVRGIDCFAAAAGPGSFTGIRVGLAAVKGLGEALGRPVVAVSTLQALAWHGSAPLRAAVIDARRGEIYGAVYSSSLEVVLPEAVLAPEAWLARLPEGELEIVSRDFGPIEEALAASPHARVPRRLAPAALASAVGQLAALRLAQGRRPEASEADANYVRRSDAEIFWKGH